MKEKELVSLWPKLRGGKRKIRTPEKKRSAILPLKKKKTDIMAHVKEGTTSEKERNCCGEN